MYFLFDSFKRSLSIFIPENLKLFMLVTVNATIKVYKTVIYTLWWLFVAIFGIDIFIHYYNNFYYELKGFEIVMSHGAFYFFFIRSIIFLFVVALASRSSIYKKDIRYFFSYLKHFIYFVFAILVLQILFVQIPYFVWPLSFVLIMRSIPFVLFISPFYIFSALFFMDSKDEAGALVTSFFKALKMIGYNYPFLFISYSIFFVMNQILYPRLLVAYLMLSGYILQNYSSTLLQIIFIRAFEYIYFFLMVFVICYFVTFYIKSIRDNFHLYFDARKITIFNILHTFVSKLLLLILMLVYLLPTIIFLLLPGRWGTQTRLFYWLEYIFSWLVLKISFLPIKIEGWQNVPKEPAIIVANHQSSLDIPVIIYILERFPHVWLAIKTLMDSPILRFILPRLAVLVDTSSPMKSMRSLIEIQAIVKGQRSHVIVFPEGGRYTDGAIHDFFGGYVILAKKMQRPVVPVYMHGLNKIYPPDTFWVHYAKVHVVIGESMMMEEHETEAQFNQRVYDWFVRQAQQKS